MTDKNVMLRSIRAERRAKPKVEAATKHLVFDVGERLFAALRVTN
jgi:hypothetical protein